MGSRHGIAWELTKLASTYRCDTLLFSLLQTSTHAVFRSFKVLVETLDVGVGEVRLGDNNAIGRQSGSARNSRLSSLAQSPVTYTNPEFD
eukprot:scaffold9230_cov137-Skeletonema_marinoi.AAC.2